MAIVLLLTGCTKEVDLPFPTTGRQVVLNGILHPDSTIRITLTETIPLDETADFPVITTASVVLYEDDRLVDTLDFQKDEYTLNYFPLSGKRYTIEATAEGYLQVKASDLIPQTPLITACYKSQRWFPYHNIALQATIQDHAEKTNYWLSIIIDQYKQLDSIRCTDINDARTCSFNDSSVVVTSKLSYIYSNSTIPDVFNSFIDNTLNGVRSFESFVRIEDNAITSPSTTLELTGNSYYFSNISKIDDSQSIILEAVSASPHYDRYLKSSVTYYLNNSFGQENDQPGLFTEPTRIYSNVENGLGIFAAYNSVSINLEDFPCL